MKTFFVLCVVALMVGVSAEFDYPIVETLDNGVIFEYECMSNTDCMDPGEEYCGECDVHLLQCFDGERCKITCRPLFARWPDEWWEYSEVSIAPEVKKSGSPLGVTVWDKRRDIPLMWKANVYKVTGQVTEEVYGAIHVAENKWATGGFYIEGSWNVLPLTITQTRYERGELVEETTTDCHGYFEFTPDTPGYYLIRTTGKDYAFLVGDSQGTSFYCGNDVCETQLGENEGICPKDCGQGTTIIPEPEPCRDVNYVCTTEDRECCPGLDEVPLANLVNGQCVTTQCGTVCRDCGDGVCATNENECMCPEDCSTQPVAPGCGDGSCDSGEDASNCPADCASQPAVPVCGNGFCEVGEDSANCLADCGTAAPPAPSGGGGDMTWLIVLLIVLVIALAVLFLVKFGAKKGPKPISVPGKSTPPKKLEQAPKPVSVGFCSKCGTASKTGDAFCAKCGNKL